MGIPAHNAGLLVHMYMYNKVLNYNKAVLTVLAMAHGLFSEVFMNKLRFLKELVSLQLCACQSSGGEQLSGNRWLVVSYYPSALLLRGPS